MTDEQRFALLTTREREVLIHLMSGLNCMEIAATHHHAVSTIRTHIKHILQKLGAPHQIRAIAMAHQKGIQ